MLRILILLSALLLGAPTQTCAAPRFCPATLPFILGSYSGLPFLPTAKGEGITFVNFHNKNFKTIRQIPLSITTRNPSFIALAPPRLYTTNEHPEAGGFSELLFTPSSKQPVNTTYPVDFGLTNYISVIRKPHEIVLVANYQGSTASYIRRNGNLQKADEFAVPIELASMNTDPTLPAPTFKFPHPHMMLPYRRGVLCPDLGSDLLWYFRITRAGKIREISRTKFQLGDGPRHAAVHPWTNTIYVVTEISLRVVVLRPRSCGARQISECYRKQLLDVDPPREIRTTAAAIRVSKDGRFLYVSVRPRDDVLGKIVGFKLDSKGDIVSKIGEWSSYGVHPRDFIIVERVRVGGMCKSFLAITNRDSDNLVLVERDVATGLLLTANQRFTYAINTPTSVLLKY